MTRGGQFFRDFSVLLEYRHVMLQKNFSLDIDVEVTLVRGVKRLEILRDGAPKQLLVTFSFSLCSFLFSQKQTNKQMIT